MKKKILVPLLGAVVLGLGAYVGYYTYDAYAGTNESELLLANAEALAWGESNVSGPVVCPDPYDVPDHYLGYTQKTGTKKNEVGGYITLSGKKFPVGGKVGATITFTYEISNCDSRAIGACCPHSKVGDIRNVKILD